MHHPNRWSQIGDSLTFALRWFPGLVLQQDVIPTTGNIVSTGTAVSTLAVYGLVLVTALTFFFKRLDVTS